MVMKCNQCGNITIFGIPCLQCGSEDMKEIGEDEAQEERGRVL